VFYKFLGISILLTSADLSNGICSGYTTAHPLFYDTASEPERSNSEYSPPCELKMLQIDDKYLKKKKCLDLQGFE
jgi:hypothetical protein